MPRLDRQATGGRTGEKRIWGGAAATSVVGALRGDAYGVKGVGDWNRAQVGGVGGRSGGSRVGCWDGEEMSGH